MQGRPKNRSAKIGDDVSENSLSSEGESHKEKAGSSGVFKGINRMIVDKDEPKLSEGQEAFNTFHGNEALGSSQKGHVTEIGCGNENSIAECSSTLPEVSKEKKHTSEKLEVMVDPIQAMLLDMIPSLGVNKAETANVIPSPVVKKDEVASHIIEDDKRLEPTVGPVKKKKVSYKDVANELLKDW